MKNRGREHCRLKKAAYVIGGTLFVLNHGLRQRGLETGDGEPDRNCLRTFCPFLSKLVHIQHARYLLGKHQLFCFDFSLIFIIFIITFFIQPLGCVKTSYVPWMTEEALWDR